MTKLKTIALLASSVALCACAASVKSNLEGKNYTVARVDVTQGGEFVSPISGLTAPTGLTDFLTAIKVSSSGAEAFIGFFFDNIDHASAWFDANSASIVGNRWNGAELGKVGSNNNLVYMATATAYTDAGL